MKKNVLFGIILIFGLHTIMAQEADAQRPFYERWWQTVSAYFIPDEQVDPDESEDITVQTIDVYETTMPVGNKKLGYKCKKANDCRQKGGITYCMNNKCCHLALGKCKDNKHCCQGHECKNGTCALI